MTRHWTRRSILALGLVASATVASPRPAMADSIRIGSLSFDVPGSIRRQAPTDQWQRHWQWLGRDVGPGTRPAVLVLGRADLPSTDAEEILGTLLASSATGLLPDLVLSNRQTRSMPGGGGQTRHSLSYAAGGGGRYHGVLLIATREQPPAGLMMVIGDETLTSGLIDGVLDSARWLP